MYNVLMLPLSGQVKDFEALDVVPEEIKQIGLILKDTQSGRRREVIDFGALRTGALRTSNS